MYTFFKGNWKVILGCRSRKRQSSWHLIPVEVEEDETLPSQDLNMVDLNDEGDGNDGAEDCEFNLQDYLI